MTWENAYYMYLRLVSFFGHLFTGIFLQCMFQMSVTFVSDHSGLLKSIEQGV